MCEAIPRMRAVDKLSLADNAVTDVGLVAVIDGNSTLLPCLISIFSLV